MPRPVFLALSLVLALAFSATPALAQPQTPEPAAAAAVEPGASARAEPKYKTPEKLTHRPSGFWTSNRPAQGGAYRYGKLIIGVILVVITGTLMFLLARKYARAPRPAWPSRHDGGHHPG